MSAIHIDAQEFAEARRDPKVKEILRRADEYGAQLHPDRELLSACKVWRQATESRLRLVSGREMSDVLLPADRALFEAIDRAETK